jgi:hypothetical protein
VVHNLIDGVLSGKRATLFNYSGRIIVGVKTYNDHLQQEINCVKPLGRPWGKPGE